MIELFDIADVNHSASSFNPEKLLWLNQQYIIREPKERLGEALVPYLEQAGLDPAKGPDPAEVAEGFRERADTLLHMAASARYCYEDFEEIDRGSAKKHLRPVILEPMRAVRTMLAELETWSKESIESAIRRVADDFGLNMGKLGQPIRVAVTSGPVSPPLDVTVYLVGRDRTLERLDSAIELIEARRAASDG
jgi:glutamyl-tRNA synthetase